MSLQLFVESVTRGMSLEKDLPCPIPDNGNKVKDQGNAF